MSPEEEKKKYYEYNPREGGRWWKKITPTIEPFFQQGLIEVAGLNPFGEPILKISWAGTLLHDYTEKPQLKYKLTAKRVRGYYYQNMRNETKWIKSMNIAEHSLDPEIRALNPKEFAIDYAEMELGRLRWVIEEWESPESLRAKGRFTKLHDVNGVKVLRDLPPKGVYNHYFWIQAADRGYREPDMQVLEAIKAMHVYEVTTSEAQKMLDWIEFEKTQTLTSAQEANQVWNQLPHQ